MELDPDFSRAGFLVVDSVAEMRTALSMTLSSFGANRVDFASRIHEALSRVQRGDIDVVLSDLSLSHPFDGLRLLEELKTRNLLKQSAVFMIVTAEANAQTVLSAAELAPDDYLLKPFSGETLRQRLVKAVAKKQAFKVVDQAILQHDYLRALAECNARIEERDPYVIDFMRLKARLSLLTGAFLEARQTYEQVLRIRPAPWARMGLGKSLFRLKDYPNARRVFESVLAENPYAMEAYDGLAGCMEAQEDLLSAQEVLARAAARSPAIIQRQRQLGELAQRNADWPVAVDAFRNTIEYARYSFQHDAGDYAQLSQSLLASGETQSAEQTLAQVRRAFHTPQADLLANVMEYGIASARGDAMRAGKSLQAAREQFGELKDNLPGAYSVALAEACYRAGDEQSGKEVVSSLLRNQHDDVAVLRKVEHMFAAVGRESEGKALIEHHANDVVELNNAAVRMAQAGDLEGAVHHFLSALAERPGSMPVALNAISAVLAYVGQHGWHDAYMQLAQDLLARVASQDPTNGKYQKMMQAYRMVRQQFGIKGA